MNRALMDYSPETEVFDAEAHSLGDNESALFDEVHEMELATGLLDIRGAAELDGFLTRLVAGAGKAAGQALNASTIEALASLLRRAANKALPEIDQLPGNDLGGPVGADRRGGPADEAGHYLRPRTRRPERRGPGVRSGQKFCPLRG